MAREAIYRRILLLVTFDAKAHGMVDFAFGHRLRVHVAMTFGAVHSGANMRRVIELRVSGRLESVNALPGNVLTARAVGRELLDLRVVHGDHLMAGHAEIDAGNASVRALIHADMAIRALHAIGEMHFVGVGNGLDGFGARSEELTDRVAHAAMRRRENRRRLPGGRRHRAGIFRGHRPAQDRAPKDDHEKNDCSTKPPVQTERGQRQITLLNTIPDSELAILHAPSAAVNPELGAF
jgi:hypothetical protein